jgi:ribonuclease VapC
MVVDTSALMAVLLGGATADACCDVLEREDDLLISAVTVAQSLMVAARRELLPGMDALLEGLGFDVVPVTAASARRAARAYARWGKGSHPAALNFGDCFPYELAMEHGCPLLFVGDDFARTDVKPALGRRGSRGQGR